jgi:hypothetical protein
MKELYTKPEVVVDEYKTVDVIATSQVEQINGDDDE